VASAGSSDGCFGGDQAGSISPGLIVGVHGIGQQQSGRHQLQLTWQQALTDGIERATGSTVPDAVPLDVAFYGDLFLPAGRTGGKSKGAPAKSVGPDELSDDELAEFTSMVAEIVDPGLLDPDRLAPAKSYTATPGPLRVLLRAVDHVFGIGSGPLLHGVFRQVSRYLRDPEIKHLVDARVEAAVTPETRIIIGHSLGSVVAFEYARRQEGQPVSLITLGCPLGFRLVRESLSGTALISRDEGLAAPFSWTNVRDPRDAVACAGDLRTWWGWLSEQLVHNGADAHAATRYLGKAATGSAIIAILGKGESGDNGSDGSATLLRSDSDR
jgi:hypothetical protein